MLNAVMLLSSRLCGSAGSCRKVEYAFLCDRAVTIRGVEDAKDREESCLKASDHRELFAMRSNKSALIAVTPILYRRLHTQVEQR
jgi:hypothetical protein